MTEYYKEKKSYPPLAYNYFFREEGEFGRSFKYLDKYRIWYQLHSTDLDHHANLIPITEDEMNAVLAMMELVS